MRNFIPLLFSFILVALISVLTFLRLDEPGIWNGRIFNPDVLFVLAYLLWIIVELRVSVKEVGQGEKTRDFGTCELYAIGQAAVFLTALWFRPVWRSPNFFHLVGFLVFLLGVAHRLWAVRTLGRYYSHIVREVDGHKIVDSGPYRYIRHPAYAGMLLANLGIVIYFLNVTTSVIYFFLFVPAVVLRILVEEKTLFTMEGYPEFAKERKRLIPAIW